MSEPAGFGGPAEAETEGEWRRLDRRTLLVTVVIMIGVAIVAGVPSFVGMAGGLGPLTAIGWVSAGAVLLIVCVTGADYIRWRRTRYRIGPERAEFHTGLFLLKRRSLARERIRSVDLTAHPLLRVLGLVKVRIGTGEQTGAGESTLELDPVTRTEGEWLRRELLDRVSGTSGAYSDSTLASFDRRWIRYAPLSFVAPLLGASAAGGLVQLSDWVGMQLRLFEWLGDYFRTISILWGSLILLAVLALVGVMGSLGLWIEMWWNYRLEREPGRTLRVRRGLFTSRSISIEERRLRGVELVEPFGVRMAGAARVDAVATGLAQEEEDVSSDNKTLLPAAPRALADEVAAQVLREPVSPTSSVTLIPHPRAARGRRLRWSVAYALVPVAILTVLGLLLTDVLLFIAALCAVILLPVAVLLALDAYRNLGHGLSGGYLVARSGTVRRATVALQRDGVIGWTIKQSYFQRRAGLLTLTATTAAGEGAYHVYDAARGEGLSFADEAVPGLLAPFLEPDPDETPRQT
ncbi:PH domain-containing protein [Streptomyces sp. NPDC056835]|uniref:PH domain-containing protein n=1 Tax=Streptomyces sp. NPDC056835 TaxID=3345956 RepID=UPI0036899215